MKTSEVKQLEMRYPVGAAKVAALVARGKRFPDAVRRAQVEMRDARAWTKEGWWRGLVRSHFLTKDDVRDRVDSLVDDSLKVKAMILQSDEAELDLRNKVASEVLRMRGMNSLTDEVEETFEFTQEFADGVKKDAKLMLKKVRRGKI